MNDLAYSGDESTREYDPVLTLLCRFGHSLSRNNILSHFFLRTLAGDRSKCQGIMFLVRLLLYFESKTVLLFIYNFILSNFFLCIPAGDRLRNQGFMFLVFLHILSEFVYYVKRKFYFGVKNDICYVNDMLFKRRSGDVCIYLKRALYFEVGLEYLHSSCFRN